MPIDLEKLYQYAANEEDARACNDIEEAACKEVPNNFFKILLAQCFTKVADSLASSKVVLPWLMTGAGVPSAFTGLLVPIRESGSLIPQLFIGGVIRRFSIRKWSFVAGSLLQGLFVLAIMFVLLTMQGSVAGFTVIALLIGFSLSRGLCSVASKDVLGKTVPKRRRGLLNGYAGSASGLVTLLISVGLFVYVQPDENLYPYLLLAAGVFWFIAAWVYANINEYSGATEGGGNAFKNAMQSLSILKTDTDFKHFVWVRALLLSTGLAAPFIVIAAQQNSSDSSLKNLGLFIAISGFASLISGRFWGRFADVKSHRLLQVTSLLSAVLCGMSVIVMYFQPMHAVYYYLFLFFALSVVLQGIRIARKTYVVDLAGGNKRTEYVSVSNTAIGLLLMIAGLLSSAVSLYSVAGVLFFFMVSGLGAFFISLKLAVID